MRDNSRKFSISRILLFSVAAAALITLAFMALVPANAQDEAVSAGTGEEINHVATSPEPHSTLFLFILEAPNETEKVRRLQTNQALWTDRLHQELIVEFDNTGDDIYFELAQLVLAELHPERSIEMESALSLSPAIDANLRQEILAMTFGVAIFSLLVQGLTVSGFVRKLGLTTHDPAQKEVELATGRLSMLYGAMEELSRLHEERAILPEVEVRLRRELKEQAAKWEEEVEKLQGIHGPLVEEQMRIARREILKAGKSDLLSLMHAGTIGSDVYKELAMELDHELDQIRMKGEE